MRAKILPLILVASIAATGAALASTTTNGTIKSFDAATHELTLADGTIVMVPATLKTPELKAGEKVAIVWDMKGNMKEASSVTLVK